MFSPLSRHHPGEASPVNACTPSPFHGEGAHGVDRDGALGAMLQTMRLFESALDCLCDAMVYVKDAEGRYRWVNRTLVQRSGLGSRSAVIGHTAQQIFDDVDGEANRELERGLIERRRCVAQQLSMYRCMDGRRYWCVTSKFPIAGGSDGEPIGLVGTCRDLPRSQVRHAAYQRLKHFLDYLDERLDDGMLITKAAAQASISIDTLERLCMEVFQLTPKQILMKMRLDRACRLLEDCTLSISDVAAECGYADHSAFARQFKVATRMTPTQYRASSRREGFRRPLAP